MEQERGRQKPILLVSETESLEFKNVSKASKFLGCSRYCVNDHLNNGIPIKGFCIDYQLERRGKQCKS